MCFSYRQLLPQFATVVVMINVTLLVILIAVRGVLGLMERSSQLELLHLQIIEPQVSSVSLSVLLLSEIPISPPFCHLFSQFLVARDTF